MDDKDSLGFGQVAYFPDLEKKLEKEMQSRGIDRIPFRRMDTGTAFEGKGMSRVDIARRPEELKVVGQKTKKVYDKKAGRWVEKTVDIKRYERNLEGNDFFDDNPTTTISW
jgi:hypothetical protein